MNDVIVDPGDVAIGFNAISTVLLTHAHFDHIYGLNEVLKVSPNALVYTNRQGAEMLLDAKKNMSHYHETPFVFDFPNNIRLVADREIIEIGNGMTAQAIFTPGHNPSCITWVIDDMVFSGDSYIPGIKTVTNLPGGYKGLSLKSEEQIKKLAINKTIFPGHPIV